ncbi:hypothetical protein PIB30_021919 [Stylosanthes scabra]|uniref:Uncharacterized protein n=1 Tax=Stylosanthes scabra TaxID=79078 RepID=A0ABU6T8R5_9FABA|nr:hypothetical protein [Stylosanthes scabra]
MTDHIGAVKEELRLMRSGAELPWAVPHLAEYTFPRTTLASTPPNLFQRRFLEVHLGLVRKQTSGLLT